MSTTAWKHKHTHPHREKKSGFIYKFMNNFEIVVKTLIFYMVILIIFHMINSINFLSHFNNSSFVFQWLSPTVFYGSSMFATSFCLLLFLTPPSTAFYLLLSTSFGILYGIQNVYLAVIPGTVFGKENLALVLGQNFFWGGVGALFGAPVAG